MRGLLLAFPVILLTAGDARTGEVLEIRIADLTFTPSRITIHAGDTITFVNGDFVDHTATGEAGGFDLDLAPGKSGRLRFDKPGVVAYICRYHPNMAGSIEIK